MKNSYYCVRKEAKETDLLDLLFFGLCGFFLKLVVWGFFVFYFLIPNTCFFIKINRIWGNFNPAILA